MSIEETKTYEVEAWALNKVWYKELYRVKANSKEEAQQKVIDCEDDAELFDSEMGEVDDTRFDFEIENVDEWDSRSACWMPDEPKGDK